MKEKLLKRKVTKRLLSVVLVLVLVFTAMPATGITAMAEETQKPVTVVSKSPEDGDGYDTILTFSKSNEKEYQYCVSYSKEVMEAMLPKYQEEVPDLTLEELLEVELGYCAWSPLPEEETINLKDYYDNYQSVVDEFGIEPVENPVAIWIGEETEDGSIDWSTCYEATSKITYLPAVTNTWILPNLLLKVGDALPTSYADPAGQFSAEIQWYDGEDNPLEAGAQVDQTSSYYVEVQITPGEGYGKIPAHTCFYFGSLFVASNYSEDSPMSFDLGKAYVTDQYEIMAVQYNDDDDGNHYYNFDLKGKFDGKLKQTTFGNEGVSTYLYEGDSIETNYESAMIIDASADGVEKGNLTVAINFKFLNEGKVLKTIYTVTNNSGEQKTFSLGSGADVQIGASDGAIVTPFTDGSGFSMVSTEKEDKDATGKAAQLNFWCQNAKEVTDVDHFWYGAYSDGYGSQESGYLGEAGKFLSWDDEKKSIFAANPENRLSAADESKWTPGEHLDSAMAWSWTDREIGAGETQTYSVLFAIGGAGSENFVSGDFTNITEKEGTITYSGDLEFNVTSIEVDGTEISSDAYSVKSQEKTITFKTSAGLEEGKTVVVTLGETPINVRNNIKNHTWTSHTHNGVKQDGQATTCTEDGWKDYYKCDCNELYEDAECTTVITDLDTWKITEGKGKIAAKGHAWAYTESGATLTATCANDASHTVSLTLSATSPTYSGDGVTTGWNEGETVAFTLAGEEDWKAALGNDSVPAIKYQGTGSTTYESETAPTVIGTYKATITKDSETAELAFEVKEAKPSDDTEDILARAKKIVTSKIEDLPVSNLTTDKDIKKAIETALLSDDKTKPVGSEIAVTKTEAEVDKDGQIAIAVKLSLNGKDITFDLNRTITALDGKNIKVTVKDDNGNAIFGAEVKVMLGKTKMKEGTSSVEGSCTFTDLPEGIYNIVVTKKDATLTEGVTKTVVADLTTADLTTADDTVDLKVVLDTNSKGSSSVDVKETTVPETAAKVEETVVNNLDALTDTFKNTVSAGESYKVEMVVEAKANKDIATNTKNKMVVEANSGETADKNKATNIDFLDIVIQKTITKNSGEQKTELIADTGTTVIEIIIPFNFTGKTKVKVLREHNGVVKKFDENNTGKDGTCKIEKDKGLIILYATNFSTYAVSYVAEGESAMEEPTTPPTTPTEPPTAPSGGNTYTPVQATGITVKTDKFELTKAGETAAIQATVQPSYAADKKLTFTSSDDKVAKVDENGVITAVGNGTATITVKTANGITKTITVTVNIPSDDNKDEENKDDGNKDDGNKEDGNKEDSSSPEKEVVTPEKVAANTIAINKGLKVSQTGSKINVSWGKVADADGYLVYAAYCGTDFGKAVKTIKDPSSVSTTITKMNGKKLDLKKHFKVYVKAYKLVDGKKAAFGKSISAHIVGVKNTKNTNVKEIKLTSKNKLTLSVGKTSKIQAKVVLVDPAKKQLSDAHAAQFRYASSDKKVAMVDKNGKITAKAKGTCNIYVYAKNGYAKKVTVTVK